MKPAVQRQHNGQILPSGEDFYFPDFSAIIEVMMRGILSEEIKKALKTLYPDISCPKISVSRNANPVFGDYGFAVISLASKIGRNPKEIAEKIKEKLLASKKIKEYVSKIEVAGSGFLNFWLSEKGMEDGLKFLKQEKIRFRQK